MMMANWLSGVLTLLCAVQAVYGLVPSLDLYPDSEHSPFELGVASGEPTPDSELIWTRCQTESFLFTEDQNLTWTIWRTDNVAFSSNGTVLAKVQDDFAVTYEVTGLEEDTYYYYQFIHTASGKVSAIGRTRTAPNPSSNQDVKIAVLSCSSIWSGYM